MRAQQTADIIADVFGLSFHSHDVLNRTKFDVDALARIMTEYPQACHLLLVGHDPDFSQIIEAVIGMADTTRSALTRLTIESLTPPRGRLIWRLMPTVLEA